MKRYVDLIYMLALLWSRWVQAEEFLLEDIVDVVVLGEVSGERIGLDISGLGDVNGDGYSDFAFQNDFVGGGISTKKSYVIFGATTFPAQLDLLSASGPDIIRFLKTPRIGNVGDFNGDGYNEIVVADLSRTASGLANAGVVFVFFGSGSWPGQIDLDSPGLPHVRIEGSREGELLGRIIRSGGDVNGDGFDDLAIGDEFADTAGRFSNGAIHIIFGGTGKFSNVLEWQLY